MDQPDDERDKEERLLRNLDRYVADEARAKHGILETVALLRQLKERPPMRVLADRTGRTRQTLYRQLKEHGLDH